MVKSHRGRLGDRYPSLFLSAILMLIGFFASGQANYVPGRNIPVNTPIAPTPSIPLDARSMFYDTVNFKFRPYQSTNEILSWLNTNNFRGGNTIYVVDSGGTLQLNGSYLNPHNVFYMFRDSVTNTSLKKMWLFGDAPGNCSGCLLAANNLSDLANAATSRVNLGLGTMATQNIAAAQDLSGNWPNITVAKFNGQLPAYYLNYNNLTNPPTIPAQFNPIAGSGISLSGTYPNITFSSTGGAACLNCNADTLRHIYVDISNLHNGYVLTIDTINNKWVLGPAGAAITQLSQDVLAGPGSGSQVATVVGIRATTVPSLSAGVLRYTGSAFVWDNATYLTNITGLISAGTNVSISGLGTSGSPYVINSTASGTGTVTSFSAGNLTPLFSTSVANASTTPALTFIPATVTGYAVYGHFSAGSGTPAFGTVPIQALGNAGPNSLIGFDGSGNPANVTAGSGITIASSTISAILLSNEGAGYRLFDPTTYKMKTITCSGCTLDSATTGQIGITVTAGGSGTVTSFSFTNGNGFTGTVTNSTTTPALSLAPSFTGLVFSNGSAFAAATVSSPLTYSAGTLAIQVANTSQNGYLSSTDWNTFNGKLSTTLASANIFVGNGSNVATAVSPSGDWTINNAGVNVIGNNKITLAKLATNTANTLIGFDASGNPVDVTAGTNITILAGVISASGGGSPLTMGTFNGQTPANNGATIASNQLFLQSADATHPGLVDTTTQSFSGAKTMINNTTFNGSGGTQVIGGRFIGTQSADDLGVFVNATQYFSFNRPNSSYDGAMRVGAKGFGNTDSSDYIITTRPVSLGIPVAMMVPFYSGRSMSLDIVGDSTANYAGNGVAWVDVCNRQLYKVAGTGLNYVGTARVASYLTHSDFGSTAFGGAPLPDVRFIYGLANPFMSYNGSVASWTVPQFVVNENANAYNRMGLVNSTTGSSSGAAFSVGENLSGSSVELFRLAATHSSSGVFQAGYGGLYTNGGSTTGLALINSGSIPIIFATSSTERSRLDAGGNWLFGTTTNGNGFITIAPNTTTNASIFFNGASSDVTSPTNGMMWYNSTTHALNFRDNGTTTNLLAGGGGSQTWQQGLTTGSTLNTTNNITNTGQSFTWTNGGTGTFKFSGILTDTTNAAYVLFKKKDSSVAEMSFANLAQYLPADTLNASNGLTLATTTTTNHTMTWGGALTQNTTINMGSFSTTFTGNSGSVGLVLSPSQYVQTVGALAVSGWIVVTSTGNVTTTGTSYGGNVLDNPTSAQTSYTFEMPSSPVDGMIVNLHFGGTIANGSTVTTSFTATVHAGTGAVIYGATPSSTVVSGDYLSWKYYATGNAWYREH